MMARDEWLSKFIELYLFGKTLGIYVLRDGDDGFSGDGYATGNELCSFFEITPAELTSMTSLPFCPNGPSAADCDIETLLQCATAKMKLNEPWEAGDKVKVARELSFEPV